MTTPQVVWNGSREESQVLVDAIARNCVCQFGMMGVRISTCPPHDMLVRDQKSLDTLLFYRRIRARLVAEEGL
jgi:hypothetical protein